MPKNVRKVNRSKSNKLSKRNPPKSKPNENKESPNVKRPKVKSRSNDINLMKYRVAVARITIQEHERKMNKRRSRMKSKIRGRPSKVELKRSGGKSWPNVFKQGKCKQAVLSRIGAIRCQRSAWECLNRLPKVILKSLAEGTYAFKWKKIPRGELGGQLHIFAKPRIKSHDVEGVFKDYGIDLVFPIIN